MLTDCMGRTDCDLEMQMEGLFDSFFGDLNSVIFNPRVGSFAETGFLNRQGIVLE